MLPYIYLAIWLIALCFFVKVINNYADEED
jgi:hypothetical protein